MADRSQMEILVMLEEFKNTYSDKKVFLTGHTGFKGAWMLGVLNYLGAKVKGYALAPDSEPSLYSLIQGNSLCESTIADIRDKEKLEAELLSFDPDFIFHFAAQSLVRRSYQQPIDTFEINGMGTAHLLAALTKQDKRCQVLIITTDKVYENIEKEYAYKESDQLGGFDPYSSSKACAEIITSSYRQSFFNPSEHDNHGKAIATARSGNVIGGGDWSDDRIIPDLVRALQAGDPLKVRNPNAIRPWQHVLEPISGYLLLGNQLERDPVSFAQAYNFGPVLDDQLSVRELVQMAMGIWGAGELEEDNNLNHPHEAGLLQLDIQKAENQLGWTPKMTSQEAIAQTMDWYKNYEEDPLGCMTRQIGKYFES